LEQELKLFYDPDCLEFKQNHPFEWATFSCGPGDFGDYLVPDKILGVDVTEACRIHDFQYGLFSQVSSEEDRARADRIFLNNMLRIVRHHSKGKWRLRARQVIAYVYYKSVRKFGAPAYWEDRNS
jgi:hypothetical protein